MNPPVSRPRRAPLRALLGAFALALGGAAGSVLAQASAPVSTSPNGDPPRSVAPNGATPAAVAPNTTAPAAVAPNTTAPRSVSPNTTAPPARAPTAAAAPPAGPGVTGGARPVGSVASAAPGAAPTAAECVLLRQRYRESQACYAPYRLANGGLRPEAAARCREVPDPSPRCGVETRP